MNRQPKLKLGLQSAMALATAVAANGAGHLAIYPKIILGEHAVAYYRLNELQGATVAVDSTTNRLHGTYHFSSAGAPQVGTAGLTTNSALFSYGPGGASDFEYITLPASALLSPVNTDGITGSPFSAECWVKPQTSTPSDYISPLAVVGAPATGIQANGSGWNFYETASSPATWQLSMRTESGVVDFVASTPITAAQWSHLAVTFDGSSAIFYVNSVAQATNMLVNYLANTAQTGAIGAGPQTGHGAFSGGVAEVAFYTYALGFNQVSNHFVIGSRWLGANAQTVASVGAISHAGTNSGGINQP